jgi:tetratricopeptide (TPR) repeat protein
MKKLLITLMLAAASTGYAQAQSGEIPEAPMGLSPLETFSVFNSFFNNKDFVTAANFGRYLVQYYPKDIKLPNNAPYRGDRTFDRMITVYSELAAASNDPTIKSAYIDSANTLYAKVLDIFTPEEIDQYRWTFNYGRYLQSTPEIEDNNNKAFEQYMKLYELDANRLTQEADGYYVQFLVSLLIGNGERDAAIKFMDESEQYASPTTKDYYNSVRDRLFSNPQERIDFLLTRGDSIEILTELYDLYARVDNRAKVRELTETLYQRDPSYTNTMRMAKMRGNDANYREAINFLEEASGKTTDKIELRDIFYEMSNNYLSLGNLQRSREFARRSSQQDPSWGHPYLKMAEIYGQAVSNCAGGTMTRQDKVVYYLVLDYLDRARNNDESVRQFVSRQYSTYQNVAPSVEEKFYQGWTTGDRIQVDGSLRECYAWINETTTIR